MILLNLLEQRQEYYGQIPDAHPRFCDTWHMIGIKSVRVVGDSMAPAYNDGDWLLFRTVRLNSQTTKGRAKIRKTVGKVVLVQRRAFGWVTGDESPRDFLQVKRIIKIDATGGISGDEFGIWVEGDNKGASTDSRHWGLLKPVEVVGVLLLRYKKSK